MCHKVIYATTESSLRPRGYPSNSPKFRHVWTPSMDVLSRDHAASVPFIFDNLVLAEMVLDLES